MYPQRPPVYSRRRPPRLLNFLCSVLLTLLLVAGIILFVLWLSLRPHRPRFYLTNFSIPYMNRQSGLVNLPVTFSVEDRNPNEKIGIYYDAIFGSVSYNDQMVGSGPVLYPFYQPFKNTTVIQGSLTAVGPVPTDPIWPEFSGDVSAGNVGLRLSLTSTVRFKVKIWDTHQHHLKVVCDFKLRANGTLQDESKNVQCPLSF